MFFRLVEVVLRFFRNGRPLLHLMKIWPLVASHVVEASTHCDVNISKRAITSLHDIVNAVLSSYNEMDFFNFNESVFASYEKLVLCELCQSEMQQELLLNSICEFVEGASGEIKSGWRSIFKSLRSIRLTVVNGEGQVDERKVAMNIDDFSGTNCMYHVQIIVDIFQAFLSSTAENMHTFSYASTDFVMCVFHLIRSISTNPQSSQPSNTIQFKAGEETFIIFLKYIQKFVKLLRRIPDNIPDSFVVVTPYSNRTKRLMVIDVELIRDSLIQIEQLTPDSAAFLKSVTLGAEKSPALLQLHRIWSFVLSEYSITIHASTAHYRCMLLEVYFPLLQSTADVDPSLDLCLHVCNHIVVPLIQNMLKDSLLIRNQDDQMEDLYMFLKSWLEVFNKFLIKIILAKCKLLLDNQTSGQHEPLELLFKQIYLVYVECINDRYHDLMSLLALSSLRQLTLALTNIFTLQPYWQYFIDSIQIGHQLSLNALKLLMESFQNLPNNFINDLERIKIITTRSNNKTSNYLRKRAQKVFFIDPTRVEQLRAYQHRIYAQEVDSVALKANQSDLIHVDNRVYMIIVEEASGVNTW